MTIDHQAPNKLLVKIMCIIKGSPQILATWESMGWMASNYNFSTSVNVKGILDVTVSKIVFFYKLDTCFAFVQHFLCTCHRKCDHKLLTSTAFFSSLSAKKGKKELQNLFIMVHDATSVKNQERRGCSQAKKGRLGSIMMKKGSTQN